MRNCFPVAGWSVSDPCSNCMVGRFYRHQESGQCWFQFSIPSWCGSRCWCHQCYCLMPVEEHAAEFRITDLVNHSILHFASYLAQFNEFIKYFVISLHSEKYFGPFKRHHFRWWWNLISYRLKSWVY